MLLVDKLRIQSHNQIMGLTIDSLTLQRAGCTIVSHQSYNSFIRILSMIFIIAYFPLSLMIKTTNLTTCAKEEQFNFIELKSDKAGTRATFPSLALELNAIFSSF